MPPAASAPKPFRAAARLHGFQHAFRGLGILVRTQHNAWLHLAATVAVVALGAACRLAAPEWTALILATAAVWSAEALNTGLEFLADEVSTAPRDLIGKAKDLGAAGVLLSSFGAAAVGGVVFYPHLLAWWERRP